MNPLIKTINNNSKLTLNIVNDKAHLSIIVMKKSQLVCDLIL